MYRIITRGTIDELGNVVSVFQEEGWTVQGGVAVIYKERKMAFDRGYEFFQAITKEDN
jgi:hypothetical protein